MSVSFSTEKEILTVFFRSIKRPSNLYGETLDVCVKAKR